MFYHALPRYAVTPGKLLGWPRGQTLLSEAFPKLHAGASQLPTEALDPLAGPSLAVDQPNMSPDGCVPWWWGSAHIYVHLPAGCACRLPPARPAHLEARELHHGRGHLIQRAAADGQGCEGPQGAEHAEAGGIHLLTLRRQQGLMQREDAQVGQPAELLRQPRQVATVQCQGSQLGELGQGCIQSARLKVAACKQRAGQRVL